MEIENTLKESTLAFAIKIVNFTKYLKEQNIEDVLVDKLTESGTIIGARVRNLQFSESIEESAALINYCLSEASNTTHFLKKINEMGQIDELLFNTLIADLTEIQNQLKSIAITA